MRFLTAITAAAVLTALPVGASAQTASATGDVRCMLTMAAVASNEAVRQAGLNGVYYFAGRIAAQRPDFNFGRELRAEAEKMTRAEFQREGTRCAEIMRAVGANLQAAQGGLQGFAPRD